MRIVAVDPHKRRIAWALFHCGELRDVGFHRNNAKPFELGIRPMLTSICSAIGVLADAVVIEIPRVYPRSRSKRPNDLIDLSTVAGACVILGETPVFAHPRTWKGQVPKEITQHRSALKLDEEEAKIMIPYAKNDHIWDAVGIGQWYLESNDV